MLRCSHPFLSLLVVLCVFTLNCFVLSYLSAGGHTTPPFVYWFVVSKFVYLSLCSRLSKIFGIGVLAGATSQHFAGPLGTEHIYCELYIVSWWEPHMCMSQPCVLALGIHGRKEIPLSTSMFFVTPGTTRHRKFASRAIQESGASGCNVSFHT